MSVLMTMRVNADAAKLEQEDQAMMQGIVARARQHGCISHHFYGSENEVLAVDEWPDEESFHRFFEASPEIAGVMERAGATATPEVTFWHRLDMRDDVG